MAKCFLKMKLQKNAEDAFFMYILQAHAHKQAQNMLPHTPSRVGEY